MKILEVCSVYPPSRGGVERFVQEISTGLARRGHKVTVITSTRGTDRRSSDHVGADGIRVVRLPEHYHLFEAPLIPTMAFEILGEEYDLLHVHGMSPTITDLSIIVGRLKKKPIVVTYHNDAESTLRWGVADLAARVYGRLCAPILKVADVVVCSTRSYAASSFVLPHLPDKLMVIPLGVEPERFSKEGPPGKMKGDTKEVLFVGQLKDYKGVDVLIRAIAHLRHEGHDLALRIAGTGPLLTSLRTTADSLRLNGSVKFLGNVDDEALVELYNQCDLFVLPSTSRREAFGLVQLEAVAAGKRVVASDIPGAGEVTRMIDGFLAKPNDYVALAREILNAMKAPGDRERLREKARSMSWSKVVGKYEALFESLVREKSQPNLHISN